ncbi:hypothetical protein DGI_0139 [Megalodesulfovibrio gigas DSM 1382 = ATCC 19364]|uniref:Uncharacterized protein n=1 Tax=Megalodesulfovibrio gigas (strain ATCC 19364 / DSM 1382 / NCIMB 9332 / VKM B-1759) TaxID=1121448 RepID=T2G7I2_MEGG1|nr:hypothetical protein DGI_0139 [Megalodesulfovibrio gigas DSM 1382 = ATCC 19364]
MILREGKPFYKRFSPLALSPSKNLIIFCNYNRSFWGGEVWGKNLSEGRFLPRTLFPKDFFW